MYIIVYMIIYLTESKNQTLIVKLIIKNKEVGLTQKAMMLSAQAEDEKWSKRNI